MRLNSSPACAIGRLARHGATVYFVGCLMAAGLFSTGCHKSDVGDTTANFAPHAQPPAPVVEAPATNQDTQDTQAGGVVNPQPGVPASVPTYSDGRPLVKPNGEPDLHVMDRALLDWRFSHQRKPSTFAEFAANPGIVIPRPPPGKKYALASSGHIILVNQ
jgi:hypothetical protein